MVNPYSVPDSDGEWFEIRNTTPGALGLHQLTIRDNDGEDFTVDKIVQVGPGEHFVFGRNWDPNKNGGAGVNYEWSGFTLSNTQDEIVLEYKGFEVDRVEWFEPLWSAPVGAAMSLPEAKQNAADNNIADHWCPASETIAGPGTDLGSPGKANPDCAGCFPSCEGKVCGPNGCGGLCGQCGTGEVCKQGSCIESPGDEPEEGDLVVNEFLANPVGVKDDDGEWIELLNLSDKTLVLKDVVVRDDGSDSFTIDQEVVVEAYGLVVLGKNGDKDTNGGVSVDYVYSGFNLANSDDEIILEYDGSLIDEVKYDEDQGWLMQDGAALGLDPWVADYELNDLADAWCPATTPFASGDLGSPGEENEVCPY